jgi:hypothetical protein
MYATVKPEETGNNENHCHYKLVGLIYWDSVDYTFKFCIHSSTGTTRLSMM